MIRAHALISKRYLRLASTSANTNLLSISDAGFGTSPINQLRGDTEKAI